MIILACLNCNVIHNHQTCPHCGGYKHLVLLSFSLSCQPEIENVLTKFNRVECNDTCAICFDTMTEGIQLPCNHIYHYNCIKPWILEQHNCPTCRQSILRYNREMKGDFGFKLNTYTEAALEELERVDRLNKKQFSRYPCH